VCFTETEDGFILSLVKSLRSVHLAAGAVVLYEGEIADEMCAQNSCFWFVLLQGVSMFCRFFICRGEVNIFMRKKLVR
jgi:hypothetical protein